MPATKVIIADPSGESRQSLGRYLREKGLETVEVSDGGKALAEALLSRPDMLLLDLSVGVLAPDRLVRILQSNPNTSTIPILFLSDRGQSVSGFRPGIDEFLKRPIRDEEIYIRIRRSLTPGSFPEERGIPQASVTDTPFAKSNFLPPEDLVLLRNSMEEGCFSGYTAMGGRIVLFLPDPSMLEDVVMALGGFHEFEPDRNFFSLHRKGEVPIGMFGRIHVGESNSLLLYAFPYHRSTSPIWYAIAPRPLGIIAFMKDEVYGSLEGLLAVSDYAQGAEARVILAVMGKAFSNFGLGENTLRMFQSRVEKLGCSLKVQEMEQLSPVEIRESVTRVVRQYLEEGGK